MDAFSFKNEFKIIIVIREKLEELAFSDKIITVVW